MFSMRKMNEIPTKFFLLGTLFVSTNRLDTLMDRAFKPFDITTKQWFLSIIIDSVFDENPTMKEAAKMMGCSHQNVKQVALKLQGKGLLEMQKDENDHRVTRMNLTEKSDQLWTDIIPTGDEFLAEVFDGVEDDDLEAARVVFAKVVENIEKMDEK